LHEAGLAEVPIISSNVGGIKDIIQNPEEGVLIPPNNKSVLADSIIKTLGDISTAKLKAQKLKLRLSINTVEKMTRATEAIYEL